MSITDDLALSMLSYSKNYQPYVYMWGERVGRDLIKERLELHLSSTARTRSVFERGLVAGVFEQITSTRAVLEKMKYSQKHYGELKNKNINNLFGDNLLKVSYPQLFLSPGSHTLLYWIGKESGFKLGEHEGHDLNSLRKVSENMNIGDVDVSKNKIILKDSIFAKEFEAGGKHVCSYYAGFAAGFLSSKKKYNVVETKCIANGDKHCEFVLFTV